MAEKSLTTPQLAGRKWRRRVRRSRLPKWPPKYGAADLAAARAQDLLA